MVREDLTGQHFGEWTVLRYLGNKRWECRCSCGKISSVATYKLTSHSSTSCGHERNTFVDLTGKVFGEWEVIGYAGNHLWNCRCSCGKLGKVASKALRDGKSKSCGHNTTGFKDIKGQHFGEWIVIEYLGSTMWLCRCSCGKEQEVKLYDLLNNKTKSCGHDTTGFIDLTGQRFGEWIVLEYEGNQQWLCKCSCGTLKSINSQKLRLGYTKSCGCKKQDFMVQTSIDRYRYGVKHSAQRHRTQEQIDMTSSAEKLSGAIISNFKEKPTPRELAELIGLTPHRAMVIAYKLGVDNLVNLNKAVSHYEDELNKLFPCQHRSDRKILGGEELDLYYPEHKLAIEFNGTYWHSEVMKDIKYHQNKSNIARQNGIHIIHIFEYEWNNEDTRKKLIQLIGSRLNNSNKIVYARNCTISEVDDSIAMEFLNNNHLQNGINSSINIGLYCSNELIGIMSFSTPRFNNSIQYELTRLSWKSGLSVVGGSERLFKYFLDKYKPTTIISYCDLSKFDGEVYKRLGFQCDGITSPNYKWVDISAKESNSKTVIPRYKTQKHKLIEAGLGTEEETEDDIMHKLGYFKIYDCGNLRFIWDKDSQTKGEGV